MPIYVDETNTREDLEKLRKTNQCKVCGGWLNLFRDPNTKAIFLACNDWPRTQHNGIEREASQYEQKGLESLNIPKRREIMEEQLGEETTTALEKARLPMTGALTQPQAMTILKLVYPKVPEVEIIRTAILCHDFGLHPLMKEVYILGFRNKAGGMDYSSVIGISASRKMAADRKGAYSFLDGTPRAATHEEIVKQFGEDSEEERDNLVSICKLKGEKGNEATGFGLWPKNKEPYGTDKGNTKRNMANIRSERPTYSRLPGAALPPLDVIDEAYVEVPDIGKVDKDTGEIVEGEFKEVATGSKEHHCEEHDCDFELKKSRFGSFYAHKCKTAPTGWCNEKKKEATKAEVAEQDIKDFWSEDKPQEPGSTQPTKEQLVNISITNLGDFFSACHKHFKMSQAEVLQELGGIAKEQIADAQDAWLKIVEAKT